MHTEEAKVHSHSIVEVILLTCLVQQTS